MKPSIYFTLTVFLFIGCSSSKIGKQYEFVEPNTNVNNDIGYLKVHTITYEEKGDFAGDPVYEVYKGYTIYSKNGDYVMDVTKSYWKPEMVKLKKGDYIVIAEIYKNIIHSFPVSIDKGKIIEVDKSMIEYPLAVKPQY